LSFRAEAIPLQTASRRYVDLIPRALTGAIVIASSLGLLSVPLGIYDDSLLVLGARLVREGNLPYLDFYTHYGPFGYTILGPLIGLFDSPGLALRVGQAILLASLAVLLHWAIRRSAANPTGSERAAPLAVLALSATALHASFAGFAFATASLLVFLSAGNTRFKWTALSLSVVGGVLLGATALIRPAFAAYVGGAVLLLETILIDVRSELGRRRIVLLGSFIGSAAVGVGLLWALLYPEIPPRIAFERTVLDIARLLAEGDRYLVPEFFHGSSLKAVVAGASMVGANLVWGLALPSRRGKMYTLAAITIAAVAFLVLRSQFVETNLSSLGIVLFGIPALLAFSQKSILRPASGVRAASLIGLAAAAFGHYLWNRPDGPHLVPSFGLAACATVLVWGKLHWPARVLAMIFLVVSYQSAERGWHEPILPIARLGHGSSAVAASGEARWGCERFPESEAKAVALADGNASPHSRFVAIASSHAGSQSNPVLLFVMSDRLPYTKWFHYDPGVQTTAAVQNEMERELLASGSDTAVVWRMEMFRVDRRPYRKALHETDLDRLFDRLYPLTIGRFGDYEVRRRARAQVDEVVK
jgi:hypothetical protein